MDEKSTSRVYREIMKSQYQASATSNLEFGFKNEFVRPETLFITHH